MTQNIAQQAAEIIRTQSNLSDVLVSELIKWCGNHIADFVLLKDDFEGCWKAEGVYLCAKGGDSPSGDTPQEALARLVIEYTEWENEFRLGRTKRQETTDR